MSLMFYCFSINFYCKTIKDVLYSPQLVVVEGIFMWNDSKSLILSKVSVWLFMALLLACIILAPRLVARLISMSGPASDAGSTLFLVTIYAGSIPAGALLVVLNSFLHRIGKGIVFDRKNIGSLRQISWCCFAGAAICTISAIYYPPWLAIGIAAAFVGLILRVVKNVFSKAVALQDDAELTI